MHGRVCVMGDFNEILGSNEKFGGSSRTKPHTVDFQNFLYDSGLVDVGYKGPAFTWTNKRHVSEAIYQRLDRVLVTTDWLHMYPNAYVNHLPMIHSDHCPILLRAKKPPEKANNFRIENWWLLDQTFHDDWVRTWNQEAGRPWKQKWVAVKDSMKKWASANLTPKKKLEKIAAKILNVQTQHPAVRDHALEGRLLHEYEVVEEQANVYWKQRSRLQWENEGDRNTRFFHTVATNRRRHNLITMVKKDDGQLTGEEKIIREKFLQYFRDLYCPSAPNSNASNTDQMGQMDHNRLETVQNIFETLQQSPAATIPDSAHRKLSALPDYHEVKNVLFQMGPDKSSGPDGVTARFLQENWHILGYEIVSQLKKVFQTEEVPDDWLKCRVTLILKTEEPQTPAEYRPISVGNIFYRLVMKIVATRLRPHIKKVISQEQSAFIKGRSIGDNIILVKEVLHSFSQKSFKQQAFLLKADINKAFDKLDWNFLEKALQYMNIPPKMIMLIINAYRGAKITININGKGDGFLQPTQGRLKGMRVAKTSPVLTHVIYADDLVIMGDTKPEEVLPSLDENGVQIFAHTMWEIWKERNKAVIEHSAFQPTSVLHRINASIAAQNLTLNLDRRNPHTVQSEKYNYNEEGWQVMVDASWELTGKAGGAYLVYYKGMLHSVGLAYFTAHDPFHAEATAMKEAMLYFYRGMGMPVNTVVQFFGDCLNLVSSVEQGETIDIPSWRAAETVQVLIKLLRDTNDKGEMRHVKKEAVYQAHCLANLARRDSISYQGQLTESLQHQGRLTRIIDEQFFQSLQDEPP
ncbi:hypothetical protein LUZ61_012145 [Rhynchospora tenuis]|uniref:Reverse transcriptase domain-containing protein n=1 Tax=Rhynchospora tenuis TaxID=198213 RepID=A0AAD6A2J3_9POAL|nr:hypothetical protein LUZ61_012145 [Rhynchospora tenuis]